MKKLTCLFLTATALLLTTIANSQSPNPLYKHLPPSANHIYSVRLGQIIAKGELAGLLTSIPQGKDQNSALALNIIKDPASAGIDLDHEILVAQTTAEGTGADTVSYTQFLVPLTDSAKWRATYTSAIKNAHLHRLPGKGVSTIMGKDGIAWNDHLLVITTASAETPVTASLKTAPAIHRSLAEGSLEKSLATLAGYPTNSLLTDQRFIAGFSTEEDVHAWSTRMDFTAMITKFAKKMAAKNPAMQGQAFPDYSRMNQAPHPPVLSTFSFENGRIVFHLTTFNKPEDAELFRKVYDRPINKDLLARVPNSGLLLGAAAMRFNPAGFPDLMDKYHTRHMVDSMLGKKGLSVSDISGIFGGDILMAALADTTATDTAKNKINVYFVATLGDPAKMMQVAAKLAASNDALADTAQVAKMKKLTDKMVIRDNLLVISGSKEMAKKYLDNTDRRPTSLLEDNTLQDLVVDLKAVSVFMSATMANNPKMMLFVRVLEKMDKIELKTTMPDGNNLNVTFQIVTGDPSTNSLKTIVSLLH
jgi:hypothetical protein